MTNWRPGVASMAAATVTLLVHPSPALAHEGRPLAPHDLWAAWDVNPATYLPLVAGGLLYGIGVWRVWRRSARGRGVAVWQAAAFATGWSVLALALVSPLHAAGGVLFSAHMTQHELIMVVAAPLFVVGRPIVAYVWGLPRPWRRRVYGWTRRAPIRRSWRLLISPAVASVVHALAVVIWHLPAPYQATLASDVAHGLQHFSFFGSALLFWWAMLGPSQQHRGQAILYLFATMLWTGALGALLAFAPDLWYPQYAATTGVWGLTPLEDQQLGGIIMWIPGGGSYLIAALALLSSWLREVSVPAERPPSVPLAEQTTWRSA